MVAARSFMTKFLLPLMAAAALFGAGFVLERVVPGLETGAGNPRFMALFVLAASTVWWITAVFGYGARRKSDEANVFLLPILVSFPVCGVTLILGACGIAPVPVRIASAILVGLIFTGSLALIPENRAPSPPEQEHEKDA